jgi:hypothetical protein
MTIILMQIRVPINLQNKQQQQQQQHTDVAIVWNRRYRNILNRSLRANRYSLLT